MRKSKRRVEPAFAAAGMSRDMRETQGFDRKDSVAVLCALLAAGAIITNALFLQRGPHPSPILVHKTPPRATALESKDVVLPRPHPAKADSAKTDSIKTDGIKPEPAKIEPVKAEPVKSAPLPAAKSDMLVPRPVRTVPMTQPKTDATPEANAPRPPDPIGEIIAPPSRRVSAVQRVLSDYGYGQIKPTGNFDRETQDAIEQFERAKKLPVTRQITPVLMRELAVLANRPLE